MAQAKTGRVHRLSNVHCGWYTVDWDARRIYLDLLGLIAERGLRIHVAVHRHQLHVHQAGRERDEYYEPIFFVMDYRHHLDSNMNLSAHLSTEEFVRYASWVLATKGHLSRMEKARYWWQYFAGKPEHQHSLLYPGSTPKIRTSDREFCEQRRLAWQK